MVEVDVLVAGSGAAGLTAALVARRAGLDVLVVEKEPVFGGTTATSGGVLWVPGNHHSPSAATPEMAARERTSARRYLADEAGNHLEAERVDAYLDAAPRMVAWMERESHVRFYGMDYPDYRSESADSAVLRSIGTVDYRADALGPRLRQLKNMLPQTLFMGLAVGSGVEMLQFMKAGRSPRAMAFVAGRMARHLWQVVRHGEGQQIVRGRALVARLAHSLFDLDVPLWLEAPVRSLLVEGDRVAGALVDRPDGPVTVRARRGVVLATGGYPGDPARRAASFPPGVATPDHRTPTPRGNTGDGIRMAEAAGGRFNDGVMHAAAWMPCSVIPGKAGSDGVWPHLVDRQKPGFISVIDTGDRYGDESAAYHDLVPQMVAACEAAGLAEASAWLIGDARAVKRWGIGRVRPFPVPRVRHLRSGYLKRGRSIGELARALGIDAERLERTVARFNEGARAGIDPDFGRGGRVYDRYQGDPEHGPNPCLGPLETGPFYAVRIHASEIGTFAGLRTDACARVLRDDGRPVPGLHAVGNDQASVFGGAYPGAGSTLGPAMTFGWIAGRDLAGEGTDAASDEARRADLAPGDIARQSGGAG